VKIFNNPLDFINIKNPVLTIGTFDGVHIGHQKIINQLNSEAQRVNGESVLFTFDPHPRTVVFPKSHGLKLIQNQVEKLNKLKQCALQNVIIQPFTKEFSELTALEFVRDYLVAKIKVKTLVIGYDHQFGKNREGSLKLLSELAPVYNFNLIEIPPQDIDDVNVSSTKIRKALQEGDLQTASEYLGAHFELCGKVVTGKGIGKQIGFPTANIELQDEMKLIPKNGVYFVKVECLESIFFGIINIGQNPTISDNDKLKIEIHILDFDENLYGKKIKLHFLSHIRNEQKFENLDQLINQINRDERTARNIIASNSF
jgi:riboflavin kinase/FMN adenylyltransferase